MKRTALLFLGLVINVGASAHGTTVNYDQINLSVSSEKQVENDIVIAELYSEKEGPDTAEIASAVNSSITWAIEQAKQVEDISVQTMAYTSQPVYRNQRVTGWRVRQSIRLKSANAAVLSELIGSLQARLAVASIRYSISPALRSAQQDELIVKALAAFEHRAGVVSKQLGRSGYRIVRLDINTGFNGPRPVAFRGAAMMEAAAVAPPSIEGGTQTLKVGVSGTIELNAD